MDNNTIRLAGIVNDSVTDGPGIRYALFVQGCPHTCTGCHNPNSLSFSGGYLRDVSSIFNEIKSNPLLTGVTFTGGEPFGQPAPLALLANKIKTIQLEIAIYTGYKYEELEALGNDAKALIALADIIVDGPFEIKRRSLDLRFKGSANQRVINVCQTILNNNVPVMDTSGRWE
ncbi:MAG: anaerobic ribonucleoside-triphosphate reductase activating protein [Christensenellaceae bacterium]|jgi:anaerobic ribonucleoside-triphosphate reductase activating protein|nr:anaerobic ribonucleoside-triphosphate reductase activating protein [Christensenellaceae bacterium]